MPAQRTLLSLFFVAMLSPTLWAAEEFHLFRSRVSADESRVHLFVRGAPPESPVMVRAFLGLPPADPALAATATGLDIRTQTSDASGAVHFELQGEQLRSLGPDSELLTVQAFAAGSDGLVTSNVAIVKEPAALYLLLEALDGRAELPTLARFDPWSGTVSTLIDGVSRHHSSKMEHGTRFDVAGPLRRLFFESAADGSQLDIVSLDDEQPTRSAPLGAERIVDMMATADESSLLVLTSQARSPDRSLLRLRLLNIDDASWRAVLPVTHSRVKAEAWLMAGASDQEVFVADLSDGSGRLRQYFVNGDLSYGSWIAPTSEPATEKLFDVGVLDGHLIAVNESEDGSTRITGFDLREEGLVFDVTVDGRPRDLDLLSVDGRQQALLVTDANGGTVVSLRWTDGEPLMTSRAVPGAAEVVTTTDGDSVFVLSQGNRRRSGQILQTDPSLGSTTILSAISPKTRARELGTIEDLQGRWLFFLQAVGNESLSDELVVVPFQNDGTVLSDKARVIPLNRTATRVRIKD